MSDHNTPRTHHDSGDMDNRRDHDDTVGAVLRPGGHLQRRSGRTAVHRSLARIPGRLAVLSGRQLAVLLHTAHDSHLVVLHTDLGESVQTPHPQRHQGRADRAHAAEVEGEGGEDAGGRRDTVRTVVAAVVRDIRQDKVGRRHRGLGRGHTDGRDADRPVAGSLQLLYQPHPVRVLQQQVQTGIRGDTEEQTLLQHTALLRHRGHGQLVVGQHEEVVLLRQQQQLHHTPGAAAAAAARLTDGGRQRVLHLQQHRRLNRPPHLTGCAFI